MVTARMTPSSKITPTMMPVAELLNKDSVMTRFMLDMFIASLLVVGFQIGQGTGHIKEVSTSNSSDLGR